MNPYMPIYYGYKRKARSCLLYLGYSADTEARRAGRRSRTHWQRFWAGPRSVRISRPLPPTQVPAITVIDCWHV